MFTFIPLAQHDNMDCRTAFGAQRQQATSSDISIVGMRVHREQR
jgi:hypothetical protein